MSDELDKAIKEVRDVREADEADQRKKENRENRRIPIIVQINENGNFSHWALKDRDTGKLLWTDYGEDYY